MKKRILMRVFLFAGLILAVVSEMNIWCTAACTETHKYALFCVPFGLFGIVFFIAAWIVYELSRFYGIFYSLFLLMVFGASGAEVAFILIQKYEVKQWCPLCLGIASTVYLLAIMIAAERIKAIISEFKERKVMFMSLSKKVSIILFVFVIGFLTAYKGAQKTGAEENMPDIFLGNKSSAAEVYIITDWFCPACRQAEQEIEKAVPEIDKRAKIVFVDFAIHPETLNFTTYNLSFLVYEKDKYLALRKVLATLTLKTKEPTQEEVQKAAAPLRATYKPLSFLALNHGMKFYEAVVRTFKVNSTPTVVINNTKTRKIVKLVGVKEISEPNILKALDETAKAD